MKKVLFRAPVLTQSGYGVHSRQILRWLKSYEEKGLISLQVQILPWGDTSWYINPNEKNGLIDYIMKHTGPVASYDVSVQLQLPNEWDPKLAPINIGMTAGVESTICKPTWLDACNKMTKVVVPSLHTKTCLESTGLATCQISVIPESYIEELDQEQQKLNLDIHTKFNVLLHGQITGMTTATDRKNVFNTIKWLCELFKDDKDFGIVLKTNMARNTLIDRKVTTQTIEGLLREVRRGSNPIVHLIHGDMSDSETAALYKHESLKALVTLTRGEGFGLPILESAVAGLPVIATKWSAHTEFLNDLFVPIDYKLVDVPKQRVDGQIFIAGSKWAEPNEFDFKSKMMKFRNGEIPNVEQNAKTLSESLKKSHCLNSIFELYTKELKEFIE